MPESLRSAAVPGPPIRVLLLGWTNTPHVLGWAARVAALGHEVHLAGRAAEAWPALPVPEGVASAVTFELRGLRYARAATQPRHRACSPACAAQELVHAHWLPEFGWIAARERLAPLICSAWGSDVLGAGGLVRLRSRRAIAAADLVLADSRPLADAARALGRGDTRVEVAHWGVDLDRFRPGDGAAARAALGWPDVPTVLSTRALAPHYRPDVLIAAFACVRERVPNARLVLKRPASVRRRPRCSRRSLAAASEMPSASSATSMRRACRSCSAPRTWPCRFPTATHRRAAPGKRSPAEFHWSCPTFRGLETSLPPAARRSWSGHRGRRRSGAHPRAHRADGRRCPSHRRARARRARHGLRSAECSDRPAVSRRSAARRLRSTRLRPPAALPCGRAVPSQRRPGGGPATRARSGLPVSASRWRGGATHREVRPVPRRPRLGRHSRDDRIGALSARDPSLLAELPTRTRVIHPRDPSVGRRAALAFDALHLKRMTALAVWPDDAAWWAPGAARAALRAVRREPHHAILSTAPPFSAHAVAARSPVTPAFPGSLITATSGPPTPTGFARCAAWGVLRSGSSAGPCGAPRASSRSSTTSASPAPGG